jgi:hypothetical protein
MKNELSQELCFFSFSFSRATSLTQKSFILLSHFCSESCKKQEEEEEEKKDFIVPRKFPLPQ